MKMIFEVLFDNFMLQMQQSEKYLFTLTKTESALAETHSSAVVRRACVS